MQQLYTCRDCGNVIPGDIFSPPKVCPDCGSTAFWGTKFGQSCICKSKSAEELDREQRKQKTKQ